MDLAKQLPTTRRENTDASRETYEGGVRAPVETRLNPGWQEAGLLDVAAQGVGESCYDQGGQGQNLEVSFPNS